MTSLRSLALLLPTARPTTPDEVAAAPRWRGVCELPDGTPADMAIQAGVAALATSGIAPADVQWLLHAGSSFQGSTGWPVHHRIQHGIVGPHGNALELKQYCSGGLASWMIARSLLSDGDDAVICTGADNWSWTDRFMTSRLHGGEPFSDVAHAAVLTARDGFATILGTGTASCPGQAASWKTRDAFWETTTVDDYQNAFSRAAAACTAESARDSSRMVAHAVATALASARISPQYVTHFVPHGSGSGEPYRSLAKALDLPWSESLYEHGLEHGYLAVSTQTAGLIHLAEAGSLRADSIVVLLATEYQLSATAMVLRIVRKPVFGIDGTVRIAA